jgi:NAD(P)-dependent dehydrogenase (short-subunit alcohol dehydrogenase family)
MQLTNLSALVTGASRGLGRALAIALAREGARVVLVARRPEPLEATAAALRAAGHTAHALVADLGEVGAIHPLAAQAAALVGPIDLLVNNASTLGPLPLRPLLDTECEDLARVLEVNLLGPFRLTRVVAGSMALRRRGVVIDVSSDAAIEAYPGWGAYGVAKAALDHLSRSFAAELGEHGVRFVAVDPGEMDTRMHADAVPGADRAALADPAEVAERILSIVLDPAATGRLLAARFAPLGAPGPSGRLVEVAR